MRTASLLRSLVAFGVSTTLVISSTGCSAFQPKMQDVLITSLPAGANIAVDGVDYGPAPMTLKLARNKDHTVIATLGDRQAARELGSKFSKTGILDAIGTALFLIPGIGLFTPGAWELDSTNIILPVR